MTTKINLFLLFLLPAVLAAGGTTDLKSAPMDELVYHAQRYGNTAERREMKARAREELFTRGADSLRYLMGQVHIENVMVQVLTQQIVEQLKAEEAAPVLLDFLDNPRARTRKLAAYFLGFYDTPQYADRVTPLLADDEAAGAAIRTLGKWHIKSAVPAIVPFLSHGKEARRIAAANALRDIGDPVPLPELEKALNDPYFTVRETAARAIRALKTPDAEHLNSNGTTRTMPGQS